MSKEETTSLSWQSVSVLGHPHSKEALPHIQLEFPVHQFLSVASCLIAWQHQAQPGNILLVPSLQILIDTDKVPSQLSFLETE